MDLQKKIISEVMTRLNRPTLKILSERTGIQISRLFRILNGHQMKLEEYQAFVKCLPASSEEQTVIPPDLLQRLATLNENIRNEFIAMMTQRIRHLNLVTGSF